MSGPRAGERDADKCIELNPEFVKGYSRKANVKFLMKEYEKALETYEKGLTYAPDSTELKDGVRRCQQQIQRFMTGMATEDEVKERQAKAMADPEVRLQPPLPPPAQRSPAGLTAPRVLMYRLTLVLLWERGQCQLLC